jgi:hypothetical protein
MDPYALNEETPKAVCARKERREGGRKKEKGKRETTTWIDLYGRSATVLYSILS